MKNDRMKSCNTCKYYQYEYNWLYEWSERICKHPQRREVDWNAEWGWLTDCPFYEKKKVRK